MDLSIAYVLLVLLLSFCGVLGGGILFYILLFGPSEVNQNKHYSLCRGVP